MNPIFSGSPFSLWSHRVAFLCSVFVFLTTGTGCGRHAPPPATTGAPEPSSFVKTVPVTRGTLAREFVVPGRISFDPTHYRRVMSRVSALSTIALKAFPGDTVTKGELLAVLRSRQFQTAEAETVSILESRHHSSGSRDLLSLALSKLKTLGASQQEIDRLIRTRQPSDRYEVRATISGTIIKTGEIEGNQVHQGDWLFEISDLSYLWVDAFLYPGQERGITVGLPVTIKTMHPPYETVPAEITRVFPMADPQTRTIPIRIKLSNMNHRFRPDLWVSVRISPRIPEAGFILPREALFENRNGQSQVIVQRGTTYQRLSVKKLSEGNGKILLSGPFLSGDQAVIRGILRLRAILPVGEITRN